MSEAADGLDAIRGQAVRRGGVCTAPAALAKLEPGDLETVMHGLEVSAEGNDPKVTWRNTARFMKSKGVIIGDYTLRRHYMGDCTCE